MVMWWWVLVAQVVLVIASLPNDLDSFLELLFDTAQCEEFVSNGELLSVATSDCPPFKCDFPRQLCMRPSNKFKDEETNRCVDIPKACITAANDGIPLEWAHKEVTIELPKITVNPWTVEEKKTSVKTDLEGSSSSETKTIETSICDMNQPTGAFCGFRVKIAYNRENQRCEQFWFPGCATVETNKNLFDTEEECYKAIRHCLSVEPKPFLPMFKPLATTRPLTATGMPYPFGSGVVKSNFKGVVSPDGSISTNRHLPNQGSKASILEMISRGISTFTGSGIGSGESSGFLDGFDFSQLPQFIQTLTGK